jgi:hypothetical protein
VKKPGPPHVANIRSRITKLNDNVCNYLRRYYRETSPTIAISLNSGHWEIIRSPAQIGSQRPLQSKPETTERKIEFHSASGVKRALHGTIYQLMILMRVFKRATDQEVDFKLATEMDAAEKFDDMVIGVRNRDMKLTYHYLQAKHKQKESSTIRNSDLAKGPPRKLSIGGVWW